MSLSQSSRQILQGTERIGYREHGHAASRIDLDCALDHQPARAGFCRLAGEVMRVVAFAAQRHEELAARERAGVGGDARELGRGAARQHLGAGGPHHVVKPPAHCGPLAPVTRTTSFNRQLTAAPWRR